jgi:hypothetical protein
MLVGKMEMENMNIGKGVTVRENRMMQNKYI